MLAYLVTFACGLGALLGRERALGPSLNSLYQFALCIIAGASLWFSLPLVASGCGLQPLPLHSYPGLGRSLSELHGGHTLDWGNGHWLFSEPRRISRAASHTNTPCAVHHQ